MNATRRGFLASLIALPVVAKMLPQKAPRATYVTQWHSVDGVMQRQWRESYEINVRDARGLRNLVDNGTMSYSIYGHPRTR